ncbi:winged helix-turn-helix domain-containing protein [Dyella acidiphila]|uniref:Winged helix-turn-helix domain-containing protein n=1 Tax=Dyella acidiphila TaxID=2775866 RepID=A0ABR9GCU4_9GAMM|nr:winged helix-turn-helix domain-containing protein [Dyella acidiphila]MBE1161857.1 winged helix-turn-helix domain-containing protein [Dyella acidiphila]
MGSPLYHFDDFYLNPLARELTRHGNAVALAASAFDCLVYLVEHRERPVGKDELVAAVWGRADVSENLLAQTIARLRRALGDDGNEQHYIKTVARVGYRWMPETTVTVQDQPVTEAAADTNGSMAIAPPRSQQTRRSVLIALLLMLALAGGYLLWERQHTPPAPVALQFKQGAAVVLPADVDAQEDWKWLSLGLMDLISTRLRDAAVPTENSRDVLGLLSQGGTSDALASFALVVRPHVSLVDSHWRVQLHARSRDGRNWQVEAADRDVLVATRNASGLLLMQLGLQRGSDRQAAGESQPEYLLRIEAAQLANEPALARQLIDNAPAALRQTPELAFRQAQLDCDIGQLAPCEQILTDLRKQLSASEQPVLRGKVLTALWYVYSRKQRFAEGEAALSEAIHLLQGQADTEALADAYLNRAHLEHFQGKENEAASDLGLARVNYNLAGNTVGQARVDYAMGMIAQRREQYGIALPLFQRAYEQYQRMGVHVLVPVALDGMAATQRMLLQFPEELAATDRFWPLDHNLLDDYTRHQLTLTRALALADNGRSAEARSLLEQMLTQLDAAQEADVAARAHMQLAQLALESGDAPAALPLIAKALAGTALRGEDNAHDYAQAWLIQVQALQRNGKTAQIAPAVDAMRAWSASLSGQDAWIAIMLLRAQALQAWSEGRHEQALALLKQAMADTDKLGVPEFTVAVGQQYATALLDSGRVAEAVAVSGQLSTWSNLDWRAAWVEASVYQALRQNDAWQASRSRAQRLAGERVLVNTSAPLASNAAAGTLR